MIQSFTEAICKTRIRKNEVYEKIDSRTDLFDIRKTL